MSSADAWSSSNKTTNPKNSNIYKLKTTNNYKLMKRKITLLAIAACMMLLPAAAQAKVFRLGVKAGVNVTDMSMNNMWKTTLDPDNNCGWVAGLVADVQVPIVGIAADVSLLYSRLNQKVDQIHFADLDGTAQELSPKSFGNDFLLIPVHLKYKFQIPVVANVFAPYLFTGPQFAFNMNKKTFDDIRNRKCQTAWDFGVGVELASHLQISGSYCLGMNNLAKHWSALETVDNIKVKNNYWTITAAWLF